MADERTPVEGAVSVALEEWRIKATNTVMIVSAFACLPAVVLFFAGQGPVFTWPVQWAVLISYLTVAYGAVRRKSGYQARLWAMVISGYMLAIVGNIWAPGGPFLRAFPVCLPFVAIVLLGIRVGLAAAAASSVILLFASSLHTMPVLRDFVSSIPPESGRPAGLLLTQGAALMGVLVTPMLLLDRFHKFLMQAMVRLEDEAARRRAAVVNLEQEMDARRRLEREIARVGDEERHRLGLDIHDGVCQQLTGALLRSEALVRRLDRGEALDAGDLNAIASLIEEAIDEAHNVAQGLCPLDSNPGALATELRTLVKRTENATDIACQFTAAGNVEIEDPIMARHLYRVAQEALSNAARHGHASRIALELRGLEDGFSLQIEDNGVGLPEGVSGGGMGLRTMAHRAHLLEGELTVTAAPGGGTRVFCRIPRGYLPEPDERPVDCREVNHEL